MSFKLSSVKGFTLMEVLVAIALTGIVLFALLLLQVYFANSTLKRSVFACLATAVESARNQCVNGQIPSNTFDCGPYQVQISVTGSCTLPQQNGCNSATTITASYDQYTVSLPVLVCYWGGNQ